MTIEEQISAFDDLQNFIEFELPVFAEQVLATDLIAVVSNRVVQKGETSDGGKFKPYSTKTIPAWRFWAKSRNQSAEKKVRDLSRKKELLSYKDFRKLNLLGNIKNFEFTGTMWRKFGIKRVLIKPKGFKIEIGGTTTATQKKINDNSEREGRSIIEASASEERLIQSTTSSWLEKKANDILNAA